MLHLFLLFFFHEFNDVQFKCVSIACVIRVSERARALIAMRKQNAFTFLFLHFLFHFAIVITMQLQRHNDEK